MRGAHLRTDLEVWWTMHLTVSIGLSHNNLEKKQEGSKKKEEKEKEEEEKEEKKKKKKEKKKKLRIKKYISEVPQPGSPLT